MLGWFGGRRAVCNPCRGRGEPLHAVPPTNPPNLCVAGLPAAGQAGVEANPGSVQDWKAYKPGESQRREVHACCRHCGKLTHWRPGYHLPAYLPCPPPYQVHEDRVIELMENITTCELRFGPWAALKHCFQQLW